MWKELKDMLQGEKVTSMTNKAKISLFEAVDKIPEGYKDNSVVDLLKETSGKLGAILKGIDKVLNSKAIVASVKDKGKSLLDMAGAKAKQAKTTLGNLFPNQEEAKGKDEANKDIDRTNTAPPAGPPSAINAVKTVVGGYLGKKFERFLPKKKAEEEHTAEPAEERHPWDRDPKVVAKEEAKMAKLRARAEAQDKRNEAIKAGKDRFKATMGSLADRMNLRKKEVDEEGNLVKGKPGKKDNGFLGKILTTLLGLGDTIVGGLTKGFSFIMKDIILMKGVPMLLKGFGTLLPSLLKMIPGLGGIAGGIAKATQGGVIGAAKGLAKGAWNIATSKATWSAAGQVARSVGTVGLRAGGMLLTGPVGWAVGGASLAYAGYEAYKYLNRNNLSNLNKLRVFQYGLDESMKENHYRIIALEDVTAKFMILTPGGGHMFKGLTKDLNADILKIFGVSEDDADFKEKKDTLAKWLSLRFFPVFKAHLDALYATDSRRKFDDIDGLDKKLIAEYMGKFTVPAQIYSINKLVIDKVTDIVITRENIEQFKTKLLEMFNQPRLYQKLDSAALPNLKGKETAKPAVPPKPPGQVSTDKPNNTVEDLEPPKPKAEKLDVKVDPSVQKKYDAVPTQDPKAAVQATKPINKLGGPMVAPTSDLEGINLVNGLGKEAIYNLDPNVNQLFTSMAAEYKKLTGKDIPVTEGFRTREHQAMLRRKYPGKAAKPGNSTHEFGLAIDVDSATANKLDEMGLMRKYGFTRPIGGEKWHLEPIGVSLDPVKAKSNEKSRIDAVEASVGKGGGGYAMLAGAVMKRRNIPYQVSLFANALDNKIDYKSITKTEKPLLGGMAEPIKTAKVEDKTPAPPKPVAAALGSVKTAAISEDTVPPKAATTTVVNAAKNTTTVAYNKATDLSTYKDLSAAEAIQKASELTGVDVKTLTRFAEIESSMRTGVKAKTSSATGLFQFTTGPKGTWKYMLDKHGATYNIPPDAKPDNPLYNSILAGQYIKDNLKALGTSYKSAGIDDTTAAYLAHHYGPTGAANFITAYTSAPSADVTKAVSPEAFASNRQELNGHTTSSYLQYVTAKVNKAPSTRVMTAEATQKPQQALYKPPGASEKTESTQSSPGMQTALYKPSSASNTPVTDKSTPDVKSTPYTYNATAAPAPAKAEATLNKNASSTSVDMSKMESIASKQLSVLESIRDIIGGIAKAPAVTPNAAPAGNAQPQSNTRVLSTERVDVSRKVYS